MDYQLNDESNDHKYFIVTPQLVWAKCRNPYDLTLWLVVKMIAAEKGECFVNTRNLAKLAMMSPGKVNESRQFLLDSGLLIGELKPVNGRGHDTWHLTIPDVWKDNIEWRQDHHSIQSRIAYKAGNKSVHVVNSSSDEQKEGEERSPQKKKRSRGDTKEEPTRITNTTKEEPKDSNPNGQKPPSEKQLASRAMFAAVCGVCQIDWKVATEDIKGKVNQTESILRKAGRKPEDLALFPGWWADHKPWKYRNFEAPEPHHLRAVMGQYMAWKSEQAEAEYIAPTFTPVAPTDLELQQIRAIAGTQFKFLDFASQKERNNGTLILEFPSTAYEMAQHRKRQLMNWLAGWMVEEDIADLKFVLTE